MASAGGLCQITLFISALHQSVVRKQTAAYDASIVASKGFENPRDTAGQMTDNWHWRHVLRPD